MKLANIESFIESMSKQVESAGFGKMAIEWRNDLQAAKGELHEIAFNFERSSKRHEISFNAFAEQYLSSKWG